MEFKNIKNILFDFDGVILDSMAIREKGFSYIFKDFDISNVEKLLLYHKNNGGLSRYHKIRFFFENILQQTISEEKVLKYANEFSEIMRRKLTDKNLLIIDCVNFIKNNFNKFSMHIVSGSDGNELNFLCKELELDKYFISIQGSPTVKNKLVKHLIEEYNYNREETVLIGDSVNDYEAAVSNGINFLGYRYFGTNENDFRHIKSLDEIILKTAF